MRGTRHSGCRGGSFAGCVPGPATPPETAEPFGGCGVHGGMVAPRRSHRPRGIRPDVRVAGAIVVQGMLVDRLDVLTTVAVSRRGRPLLPTSRVSTILQLLRAGF
jgi:hypothetical protein